MRKIDDLVITLENEKGEDIEIRTKKIDKTRKNLGHWKEPAEIKEPNQFPVSVKTSNRNIRCNIHSRSDSTRGRSAISRSVLTKGRISVATVVFDRKACEKDKICFSTEDYGKM